MRRMRARSTRTASVLALAALTALAVVSVAHARADAADPACDADSVEAEPAWHAERCGAAAGPAAARAAAFFASTPYAFAHDIGPLTDNFVRHLISDFPGQLTLGPNAMSIYGYDFDAKGDTLYALDQGGQQLGKMTLTNGAFTAIGPSVPLTGHLWTGLTSHPRTGKFYASSSGPSGGAVYTIDPATGTATLIDVQMTTPLLIDISINCAGVMFGHDIGADSIYRINKSTAVATLVGPTGYAASFAQGMDFDNRTGKLYAYLYLGGGANHYGTVNLTTGALTPLASSMPQGEFEGATRTRCPGPNTTITKKPKKQTAKKRAVFRFKSSFAPSKFECKLDGKPYVNCSSPWARTVKLGAHRFSVRAKDPVGNKDATPATFRWRVVAG